MFKTRSTQKNTISLHHNARNTTAHYNGAKSSRLLTSSSHGHRHHQPFQPKNEAYLAVKGYVHSLETFSALEGIGLRYLVFMQGCPSRCVYCENPDTWQLHEGHTQTVGEIMEHFDRYQPYMKASNGGISLSGGEPLMQPEFSASLMYATKQRGFTTALETSGQGSHYAWDTVLPHTDTALFCLKHPLPDMYRRICGNSFDRAMAFVEELEKRGVETWIRYVVLPGWTDRPQDIDALIRIVNDHQPKFKVSRVELLPYHRLGRQKWDELQLKYIIDAINPPTKGHLKSIAEKLTSELPDHISVIL